MMAKGCGVAVLGTLVLMFVVSSVNCFLDDQAFVNYKELHCDGNRHGIVHLFEWRWDDIAKECKNFLGPYGFCAVQISPPNENRVITSPSRPWYERYQPVSYKLVTRSGNETEFGNMVRICNENGVRIYADVVINHMTDYRAKGYGTAGSYFDATKQEFSGVPYGPLDFNGGEHCKSKNGNVNDYKNVIEVRNCRLLSLLDLKLSAEYVRNKVAGYMNHLVDLGVAGFKLASAKHMWPGDLDIIMKRVKDVSQGGKPFLFHEVMETSNEPIKTKEYVKLGRVTNFKFGYSLAQVFRKKNAMKYLSNWGSDWGMMDSEDAINFIDNHDNQRSGGVLSYKDAKPYKMATAFMLAHPYGVPRILSGYDFKTDSDGPPHNFADTSIAHVTFNGLACKDGWICEHRWRQIYNMVAFRNIAAGSTIENWWSGADYQIAFSRGNSAFIAFNLEDFDLKQKLQTGLFMGTYCDVISGNLENGKCTGHSITVDVTGQADIHVCSKCDDPMVAFHTGAKVGDTAKRY